MQEIKAFQRKSKSIPGEPWGRKSSLLFTVEYGLHQLGEQEPYFSITVSIDFPRNARPGTNEDTCIAGGCLHDEITKEFPELAGLIPWHLVSQSGQPMHYLANALYHLKQGKTEYFRSTAVYGALPSDYTFNPETATEESARTFLENRAPMLRVAFEEAMKHHGCQPIVNGQVADW